MGLTETNFFMSYFLYYICLNTLYAFLNSFILMLVFHYVNYFWIFAFFWLYGLTIFSLAYFFQSFMDKTRVAMIISLLLYFVMYFLSALVRSPNVVKSVKTIMSVFPPIALQLGVIIYAKFEVKNKFNLVCF